MDNDIKKYNKIPYRLSVIEDIIKNKNIDTMIDTTAILTENISSTTNTDIRTLLPKKYLDFNKVIGNLGGKLLYIKSGSTGHTFKGVYPPEQSHMVNYAVKVVAYPRTELYGDMFNVKRPENAELMMNRL